MRLFTLRTDTFDDQLWTSHRRPPPSALALSFIGVPAYFLVTWTPSSIRIHRTDMTIVDNLRHMPAYRAPHAYMITCHDPSHTDIGRLRYIETYSVCLCREALLKVLHTRMVSLCDDCLSVTSCVLRHAVEFSHTTWILHRSEVLSG